MDDFKYVLLEQYFPGHRSSVSKYVYKIKKLEYTKGALVMGENYVGRIIKEVRKPDPKFNYHFTSLASKAEALSKLRDNFIEDYYEYNKPMEPGMYYIPNYGYDYFDYGDIANMESSQEDWLDKEADEYAKEILDKLLNQNILGGDYIHDLQ